MTQAAPSVNDAEAFLSGFSGNIFIRLLHNAYDPETQEPRRLRPRQFYGSVSEVLEWLENTGKHLNDGSTEDRKFSIYYCANDPKQGQHAQQGDIGELRCIYQDCDEPELALNEPELDGQQAHSVVESSPGKRQRIWHIDPLDPFRQRAIHDHMAATRFHDASTHGPARLLRLPGFRNWKYEDGPVARLIEQRNPWNFVPGSVCPPNALPRLTRERVFKAFGFHQSGSNAGNPFQATAHHGQQSGDLPEASVYSLERERAKRQGLKDLPAEAEQQAREARDIAPGQLALDDLLNRLALIEPDTHRNEWRRVLAALHFMADGRDWGKVIGEAWSAQGLEKWNPKSFAKEWNGLSADVPNPASWLTIQRMTRNRRHNKQTRALRNCALFKRFEEELGPVLEYRQLIIEYPISMKVETADGPHWRPDPRARQNVEYLLELEAIEVFYDEFAQIAMAIVDGNAQEIDQKLIMELYSTAHVTKLRIDDTFLSKQVEAIALDTKRDPVREYLSRLPAWDGQERLKTVLQRLMGAPDTPSVREVMPLLMCAIVRRTFRPGYKFDLMPILEGKQGKGKSSFFRVLMPVEDWFAEGPKMNEEPKRLLSQLSGKLVVEFGELAGMSKQNIDVIKKLITTRVDEYVANYARKKTRSPRRCVFIGSVDKTQYLRDLSDNRRFPVIPVTMELNYDDLIAERDQLWAEALLEEGFIDELRFSAEAEQDMKVVQEARLDVHSETTEFMNDIRAFKVGWLTTEDVWQRLGLPFMDRSRRTGHAQYLFKEIKDLMERDGWTWNGVMKYEGKPIRAIFKKPARGTPPKIVCNGGVLVSTDKEPTLEELLS